MKSSFHSDNNESPKGGYAYNFLGNATLKSDKSGGESP